MLRDSDTGPRKKKGKGFRIVLPLDDVERKKKESLNLSRIRGGTLAQRPRETKR